MAHCELSRVGFSAILLLVSERSSNRQGSISNLTHYPNFCLNLCVTSNKEAPCKSQLPTPSPNSAACIREPPGKALDSLLIGTLRLATLFYW